MLRTLTLTCALARAAAFRAAPAAGRRAAGGRLHALSRRVALGQGAAALGSAGFSAAAASAAAAEPIKTASGLEYTVTEPATGAKPTAGQTISAHYTGSLDGFADTDRSKIFDSSRDRGKPLQFKVGTGMVIKGWDEMLLDMGVGERRKVVIPANMGYGDRGAGGVIPAGATLYFDMQLLKIIG